MKSLLFLPLAILAAVVRADDITIIGDGRFFYPPLASVQEGDKGPILDAPVGSIRGEMLRDGIEDYEYFVMLKRLPAAMEAHRVRLARAIVQLMGL